MKRRGVTGASHMAWWTAAAGIIVFVGLSVGSMMLVSKPVSASYEKAMSFANSFCKDYPRGVADTAWITAPDGGRVINADKGARTVKVKVHIAGKYCPTYSANLAGSSYFDTKNPNASEPKPNGRITGNMDYNNNGGGNTFYVTELKDFDVKDLSKAAGRVEYPVHMALETYTKPYLGLRPSPSITSIIVFNFTEKWRVEGSTSINRTTAYPGDEVRWTSVLTNKGPSNTSRQIENRLVNSNGWSGTHTNHNVSTGKRAGEIRKVNSPMRVTQEHVGKTYCQSIQWRPGSESQTGTSWSRSTERCATIPYRYELRPSITSPADGEVIEGPITVSGEVRNLDLGDDIGQTKSHRNIRWEITQLQYDPGATINPSSLARSPNNACDHFTGNSDCTTLKSGTESSGFNVSQTRNYTGASNVGNLRVGSRVCYAMSVTRWSSGANGGQWRHSDLNCMVVGKAPKVQVHGGSLQAGRSFVGESSTGGGGVSGLITRITGLPGGERTFGSWVEYGILATGQIRGVASGAGLGGEGSNFREQSQWSGLSFTRNPPSSFGGYRFRNADIPPVKTMFPAVGIPSVSGSLTPVDLAGPGPGGRVVSAAPGPLTIRGGTLGAGKWAVLNAPETDVTIDGNIDYTKNTLSRTTDIPQLVIIARTITINHDVERVNAWLIAENAISTCEQKGTAAWLSANESRYGSDGARLTHEDCRKPLTVNGPVMTNKLYLRRTAGSNPAEPGNLGGPGEPAETFNLRADAYLWIDNHRAAGRVYQTTNLRELPPRY